MVDVIIPIFNAYEALARCLESIRATSAGEVSYRLILIDDASEDPRIFPFLEKMKAPDDLLLKNENNLGFVQTANRGMAVSQEHDVVLLNSDTLVTEGWLAALQKAAYQHPSIGGANPLTNCASIFSVPELSAFAQPTSLQKISRWIKNNQKGLAHDIPSAVGFCFYIKRCVIREVGLFDEIFGRGYGEENDFCMKAKKRGYRFVLTNEAFVYHEGHVSMKAAGVVLEGQEALPAHQNIIDERYPGYSDMVQRYAHSGVMQQMRSDVLQGLASQLGLGRKRILYFLHHAVDGSSVGGAEFHVRGLVEQLKQEYVCYVARIENNVFYIDEYVDELHLSYAYPLSQRLPYLALRHPAAFQAACEVLTAFAIDLVHMHLTMNNNLEIVHAAKTLGIPVFLSLHDYYCASPDFNLSYKFHDLTWNENRNPPRGFFYGLYGARNFNEIAWRQEMAAAFRRIDEVLVPSHDTLNRVKKYFKRTTRIRVIEHGVLDYETNLLSLQAASRDSKKFSICFLGYTHAPHKGAQVLPKIIPKLLAQGIEVHLLGTDAVHWKRYPWAREIHIHGSYQRSQVIQKIRTINPSLVAITSICPETFSYTLNEAWAAGVPVVVPPIGAPAERVQRAGGGVVLSDFKPETFIREVMGMVNNKAEYSQLQKAAENMRLKTADENTQDYRYLYESYFARHTQARRSNYSPVNQFKLQGQKKYWGLSAPFEGPRFLFAMSLLHDFKWMLVPFVRRSTAWFLALFSKSQNTEIEILDGDLSEE